MGVRAGMASVVLLMAAWASLASTPPPIHIRGHVFDAGTRRPLPDARVGIFLIPPGLEGDPERMADVVRIDPKIADDGSIDVVAPPCCGAGSNVSVFAQAPGHAEWAMRDGPTEYADRKSATLSADGLSVEIPLRAGRTLEGTVTDAEGKPIEGVHVELHLVGPNWSGQPNQRNGYKEPWAWPGEVVSDGSGRWRILGFAFEKERMPFGGRFLLIFQHDRYAPELVQKVEAISPIGGIVSIRTTMVPGRSLRGIVLDATGKPISGARVVDVFLVEGPGTYPVSQNAVSDDLGRFEIRGLRDGTCGIEIRAKGFAVARATAAVSATGAPPLTVRLTPGATLEGRLLRQDGRPLPWVVLSVQSADHAVYNYGTTDADGRFEIDGLGKESVVTRAMSGGLFPPFTVQLPSPPIEIRVTPRRQLIVEFFDKGTNEPAETNGTVDLHGPTGQQLEWFDHATRVTFGPVCEGSYTLAVQSDDFMPQSQAITMSRGPGQEVVRLHLTRGFALSGRVVDAAGRPVPKAEIMLVGTDLVHGQRAVTGDDGRYRAAGLSDSQAVVGNVYFFEVHAKGKAPAFDFQTFVAFSPFRRTHDFVLEEGGTVRGRIVHPDGRPVEGTIVRAYIKKYFLKVPVPVVSDYTDADGRYELRNVPSGSIVVNAGGEERTLDVGNLETRDLDLTIPETAVAPRR